MRQEYLDDGRGSCRGKMTALPSHSPNTSETTVVLRPPFSRHGSYCYAVDVKDMFGRGNGSDNDSRLYVFEDGKALGPPHTPLTFVESEGNGRFIHSEGTLYFSTSDNSDPTTNGRHYSATLSGELYFAERYAYCRTQVNGVFNEFKLPPDGLKDKRVLEIGPGRDAGIALIMAGLGATHIGVEKYRSGWRQDWHSPFIDAICKHAPDDFPGFNPTPLRRSQKKNGFDPDCMGFYQTAMEDFSATAHGHFDLAYSCAVLEHICEPATVLKNIFDATKPGGHGLHYIDFRDHRNFNAPLEFLLMDDQSFETEAEKRGKYAFGNRTRYSTYLKLWQHVGFNVVRHGLNMTIEEDYLQKVTPKLRAAPSRYKDTPEDDLRAISGYFVVQRS